MSDDLVNIEVNGVPLKARKGQMIMQVTDPADIYIPRFCYHEKLTVAANCRMCLVEVEKAPKPMPACATPVMEGMKVFTQIAEGGCRSAGDHGIPADQSSARLPDLRSGRRVRAAGPRDGLRPRHLALHRAQAGRQGQEPRSAGLDRHDPLHPVHALRALRSGDSGLSAARHHRPRRAHAGRDLRRAEHRPRALGEHHRSCAPWARSTTSRSAITPARGRCRSTRWCRRTTPSARISTRIRCAAN